MEVRRLQNAAEFLEASEQLLLDHEARHNLMLGLAATIRDHPEVYPVHRLWIVRNGDATAAAALRTPPHNLVVARPTRPEALEALARELDDDPPGVVGAVPEVREFAAAWAAEHGRTTRRIRAQGVFALERVRMPSSVPGRMRAAHEHDRSLLVEWWGAFGEEALGERVADSDLAVAVDQRLTIPSKGIVIWEAEDGQPASFAGFGDPTRNGVRIGPVYTPPERRGRGYASALVATLSQQLLDSGRRFCFLFTDLANPTANRIYERIGYERVCEAAEIAFDRA